jgi:hypothetical protein
MAVAVADIPAVVEVRTQMVVEGQAVQVDPIPQLALTGLALTRRLD